MDDFEKHAINRFQGLAYMGLVYIYYFIFLNDNKQDKYDIGRKYLEISLKFATEDKDICILYSFITLSYIRQVYIRTVYSLYFIGEL